MNYSWQSFGDETNKIIALIAPSNGRNQDYIKARIDLLVAQGFCVKAPQYEDGNLVVQSNLTTSDSRIFNSFFPAVVPETGAAQIIDCIRNGWNIMPYMGGDSFEEKLPAILDYFKQHPDEKNPEVKIFGVSNATFATFLQAQGICTFVSTPFPYCIVQAESDKNYKIPAGELLKIMREEDAEIYPRKVITNPENKLSSIKQTKHYVLNTGPLCCDVGEEYQHLSSNIRLQIPESEKWSVAIEGFIENGDKTRLVNYGYLLEKFLEKHQNNLPQFIEIGCFATRLDGINGYQSLVHNKNGLIEISDYNVDKILQKESSLMAAIKDILQKQEERKIPSNRRSIFPDQVREKVLKNEVLIKEDIIEILKQENQLIGNLQNIFKGIAEKFSIPLIFNARYGHTANMAVVNGGDNVCHLQHDQFALEMIARPRAISPRSSAPVQEHQQEIKL